MDREDCFIVVVFLKFILFCLRNNGETDQKKRVVFFMRMIISLFEFFLIVLYCLNRVQKHAKEYYTLSLGMHACNYVIKPYLPINSIKLQEICVLYFPTAKP